MPTQTSGLSNEVLQAALAGLEAQKQKVEGHIQQVRAILGVVPKRRGRPPKSAGANDSSTAATTTTAPVATRKRSPEVRARMAEAQRKRWAALKQPKEEPAKKAPTKRKLSAAARKRISDATKKRWAAYKTQKAAS